VAFREEAFNPKTVSTRSFSGKYAEVTIMCGAGHDPKDPSAPSCMVGVGTVQGVVRRAAAERMVTGLETPKFAVQMLVPITDPEQMQEFARLLEKALVPVNHQLDLAASNALEFARVKSEEIRDAITRAFDVQSANFADQLEVAADTIVKEMGLPGSAEITMVETELQARLNMLNRARETEFEGL